MRVTFTLHIYLYPRYPAFRSFLNSSLTFLIFYRYSFLTLNIFILYLYSCRLRLSFVLASYKTRNSFSCTFNPIFPSFVYNRFFLPFKFLLIFYFSSSFLLDWILFYFKISSFLKRSFKISTQ